MADETQNQAPEQVTLDLLLTKGNLAKDDTQKPFARDLVEEFVKQVIEQGNTLSNDSVTFITQRIQQIDDLIAVQLN